MIQFFKRFPTPSLVRQCVTCLVDSPKARSPNMEELVIVSCALLSLVIVQPCCGQIWPSRVIDNARVLSPCEGLGFPNATDNACGFCTGGSTGLHPDYGKDCAGSCKNGATFDCAGICGGTAFIDECSGECIGGTTGKSEYDVMSYRDCRGYCSASGGQFFIDTCGVCHTGTSPFQDCTNRCHLPGQEDMMAKLLCGRCVGGTTNISESEVLDSCGNCRGEMADCPCNGTGKPDPCGVCKGGGISCFRVQDFHPRAIPKGMNAMIFVQGAFYGRTRNVKCVLIPYINDEPGNHTEFPGMGNGTHVRCSVRLKPGSYQVGVKLEVGDPPETDYVEEKELLVYDEADYTTMTPTKAIFDRAGAQELEVTFSGGRVPNLPLICVITVEGWPLNMRLAPSESNTLDTCVIPYPKTSMKLNVAPSFNGIHVFKNSFELKFFASPPDMSYYYIAEDGHAVVVVFDRPVNLCNLDNCTKILNSQTLDRLGEGAVCKWATKQQLIIMVLNRITANPFKVTFKKGVLKQDGQKYALTKNDSLTIDIWYPQPLTSAQLAISGPSTVPNCGIFTLVGHFSSPKGDAEYYWTAIRPDHKSLEENIQETLSSITSASLTLNASILEVDVRYIFILTAQHPVNEKYEARHEVVRLSYIGPLVTAYSDVMTLSSVTIDQRVTLQAEITLPECSTETEILHLMWSVNNPKAKFNFKDRDSQVYVIEPYSLPENSEVIFTAHAFFGNMLNITSSHVVLRVEPVKLKAMIKGSAKRVVGNKSGNLVLESEVMNVSVPLIYQWKCFEENRPVCYNYKKNATEPLLIPRKMQSKPKLVIPCDSLKAGQKLRFELQVFNASSRNKYSQVASVVVIVEDKNIPQVVIDSVVADGINYIERNPVTGAYSIPAGLPVAVYATLTPVKNSVRSVKWAIKGFSASFTSTTFNKKTILSLEEGFLVGHGIYLIGLSACDGKGSCGIANLTIHAIPGVALCKLEAKPYVEYETMRAEVKGCSVPPGRQPVTYQLHLHTMDAVFPITAPQTSTVFNIIAPPVQVNSQTQVSVQVCDKYSLCKMFFGPVLRVSESENKEEDRKVLMNKALHAMEIRDPLSALSLFSTAASDTKAPLSEVEIGHMLEAGAKATHNRYLNAGQLSLIYSSMLPLLRHSDNRYKLKALDVIKRATKLAFGYKIKVPISVLSQGHSNAAEALRAQNSNSEVQSSVKKTLNYFVEKISASSSLGSRVLLSSNAPGYPTSLIFRQLLDRSPIYIKAMSNDGMVEGSVRFEDPVRERVRSRKCEKKTRCEGIVVAVTIYPAEAPYESSSKRTSPVLEISLRQPEDGKMFKMADVPDAIRLAVTHKGNYTDAQSRGVLYKCSYWDEAANEWSAEGLFTFGIDGNVMRCWSSHLTAFAILETYGGLSTGSIVGIVVTVLMGVFIIAMLAFFFFRKKQASNTRVSNEALQPKRQSNKLQGMNGSVVRVKTVTP